MKKIALLFVLVLAGCSSSVSTKIANKSYQRLEPNIQLYVLDNKEVPPVGSEFIGDIKIGDSGFTTNCSYNSVISDAKTAARSMGANLLQITEIKEPNFFTSTCYRIKAKAYRNLTPEGLEKIVASREKKNKSRLPDDADYALIHFYRPNIGPGSLLYYAIKNDKDSVVGKMKNGEKFILKTKDFGSKNFYGVLETKETININIEKRKEYFVRCGVKIGVAFGRPEINLIENHVGIKEFNGM